MAAWQSMPRGGDVQCLPIRKSNGVIPRGIVSADVPEFRRAANGRNCYAERIAARFSGPGMPYAGLAKMTPAGPRWTGDVRLVKERLADPLRWRESRRIFVNSMADLFHERLSNQDIAEVFAVMALAKHHTFQVLTKRPQRMLDWFTKWISFGETDQAAFMRQRKTKGGVWDAAHWKAIPWPLPNVWLGVSVEDQRAADERIPLLLQTPAAVRFLSIEPLLGPVVLPVASKHQWPDQIVGLANGEEPDDWKYWAQRDGGIRWVIVGGESGPGARPMHPGWARSLRDQCAAGQVPFFFKQWGEWRPQLASVAGAPTPLCTATNWGTLKDDGRFMPGVSPWNGRQLEDSSDEAECVMVRVGKSAAGALLDGVRHVAFPEVPR